ncbi:pyridoxal phosphate-dependent aminotransferase [Amycolatopsis sp. BJA-103]|uniref:pyridoxal phosphate-dependent aminotransferase n=1 Tax=Amycolatopsis sp. BJA-103 TaxID=1911175 RepID=UPI000C764A04|nr:pyridoxal phosphate-dependent aminotransferase [Amycolatopsis sp. BJA-103]AUI60380.1 aspartate aminotransferase [Amycolatopsis sp. BJA-103]PNE16405.1 aspartate aminotransferase [Amycolatopsis sp. BJA-103]
MSDIEIPQRASDRVASIAESATLAVDARAKALIRAGRPVIVFASGEPDFPTPAHITEAAANACFDPGHHRYSPPGGMPELKASIATKTYRDSGFEVDTDQILVTNGGKQAIYESFAALLNPGDEVLVPSPYWPTYPAAIRLAGGVPIPVDGDASDGFRVNADALESARSERTTMLVLSSPANPTGVVYTREQLELIGRWAATKRLWVLTDEIYEHLVYGEAKFHSLPVVVPETRDRCVVINGVAKAYAMTGWRVGWALAPRDVTAAMTALQSHLTSNVCNVAQTAAIAALSAGTKDIVAMRGAFDRRRRLIVRMLNEVKGITCPEPDGAFYVYVSAEGVLGKQIRGHRPETTIELASLLLEEADVAVVPGEPFGTPGHLRLSYALSDEHLVEGVTRIRDLLAEAED